MICTIDMGQKISSNEILVHSMKKMRLSNSDTASDNNKNADVVSILDISSPSSPVRKQSSGECDMIRRAINAPFENDCFSNSSDENGDTTTIDLNEADDVMSKLVNDTPVLQGK